MTPWAPAQPVSHLTGKDWWGGHGQCWGLWLPPACFPAFHFYLSDIQRDKPQCFVFMDLPQIYCPQPAWFGENSPFCLHLTLFIFWTLSYLSASSQLTSDFVSKFIYALFARFPIWEWFSGYWRGKGDLSTHFSFVLRGKMMPFIVQINDQISTSVQSSEINSS